MILSASKNLVFADTLKVHVTGYFFNGETYKIYYNGKEYTRKMDNGLDAFAFYIYIPDTIHQDQIINMHIFRKGRFSRKYKDIKLTVFYDERYKYLILLSDHRLKKKYTLRLCWSNSRFYIKDPFWDKNIIPDWAKCNSIKDSDAYNGEPLIK